MANPRNTFQSAQGHYVAERWDHGTVLTFYPVARGSLCDGVKVAEGRALVTLANTGSALYDALIVARMHASSLGHPQPELISSVT